jgi:general secretion pathway protein C
MVMTAGKEFAHTLRGGVFATCELAGISALGVSLAALMWSVVTPKGVIVAPAAQGDVTAGNAAAETVMRLSRIADPFVTGQAGAASAVAGATGFTLHATRAMGDGDGTAILSPSGGAQSAYAVGEEITPGVMLAAVSVDHVEIDVGGQRMRVAFPGGSSGGAVQAAASLPADYQAAARAAPPLSSLPLQPVNRNGRSGFEVMPQASVGVLAAAGLQPGDIVVSINGADAASADLSVYRAQLASGQSVEIRYERGGQIHTTRLGTE